MINTASDLVGTDCFWSQELRAWVRVLDQRTLFGQRIVRVVAEGGGSIHTVPADTLLSKRPFDIDAALSTVACARLWQALGSDLFLAPMVSAVLPLPHQFRVLRRAMGVFPVRMMLADEVGMGKTIEAGLILKEMKLRGMAERILILAPKSLLLQWVVEMDTLFAERFDLVLPADWGAAVSLRGENAWQQQAQVITSVDAVKPKDAQRGWSDEKLASYNTARFHDLVGAGWDLVIIDESHLMAGASEDVSRYELAKELSKTTPHLLLLTATPHSGKSDAFRRLLGLIDPAIATGSPLTRSVVESVVIRSEKRSATDADGKPLFAPRVTRLVSVPFGSRHGLQQRLYEDASEYILASYNKAVRTGDKGSRLLLILIQRLVSSSTRALRRFLEQRRLVLQDQAATQRFGSEDMADNADLDEVAQLALFTVPTDSHEIDDVERLLALAVRVESAGPDARAEALYDHMVRLSDEDNEPSKKFLVFTEFTATQEMLCEFLEGRGYSVTTLNGGMDIAMRKAALESFRGETQVLVSTDAGGVGLNMQFAHIVFNYCLPFAPMKVEQRIGRLDRVGQTRPVQAFNLVLENSVEARLYDIWQAKLATILAEFGVDKTGDVLDSASTSGQFDRLARTALFDPTALDAEFDRVMTEVRKAAEAAAEGRSLYADGGDAEPMPTVPLHAWMDTMVGGVNTQDENGAPLTGVTSEQVIAQINALTPFDAEGKSVPHLTLEHLGFPLDGWFSLWKVGIADGLWRQQQVFGLFTTLDGQSYAKAAQRLWDEMAARQIPIQFRGETECSARGVITQAAEDEAAELYMSVVAKTREVVRRRQSALDLSYLARRSALSQIELDAVREVRRRELEVEYRKRKAETARMAEALPDLRCLFLRAGDSDVRWTDFLRDSLVPSFGGVPTFCEDPDGLLDVPEVRETLRASGMTVGDWDGLPLSLVPLKSLADDAMPLLIVEAHAGRHVVESCLKNYRWETVSVGQIMPKFAQDVVKSVPKALWDRLLTLHDEARAPRTPQETAILIARALYGIDPDFLRHGDGWFRLLVRHAAGDEPLPMSVAQAVATVCPPPTSLLTIPALESLMSGSAAHTALLRALAADPDLTEQANAVERTLISNMGRAKPVAAGPRDAAELLAEWEAASASPLAMLEFGRTFAEALARGLPADVHGEINARFTEWLLREYGLIQTSPNPAVLRLPTLVKTLDAETSGKLLLVVVDALGLVAWSCIRDRWLTDGIIGSTEARTALAVLPTITSLSRRALFEGKPPMQFSDRPHSQGLERKAWATRFGDAGDFFTVDEAIGFADGIAKGMPRIALLDVTWDKRGHSIDPRTDSIADAARTWAGRTPLRDMVRAGLAAGYRVILTADHGQIECWGQGRPNVGSLPEERSKRVIVFKDKSVSESYATGRSLAFRPGGLAQGIFPLFATGDTSFDLPGVPSVSHGGLSLDEALVPVVEVYT